ncbi:hypothetical protein [Mesorhizobium sp.]|nr:hypothetical protein [Mesorhizobium sp.]
MPNTTVRAAAEGMPNYPRNPHRFSFVRKLLMRGRLSQFSHQYIDFI